MPVLRHLAFASVLPADTAAEETFKSLLRTNAEAKIRELAGDWASVGGAPCGAGLGAAGGRRAGGE